MSWDALCRRDIVDISSSNHFHGSIRITVIIFDKGFAFNPDAKPVLVKTISKMNEYGIHNGILGFQIYQITECQEFLTWHISQFLSSIPKLIFHVYDARRAFMYSFNHATFA